MTVVNFTTTKNTLTGGSAFFVSTLFCENKSTDLRAKSLLNEVLLFLEPITFGEAKSTDDRAMGSWTDGHIFETIIFQNPLPRIKSIKKEVGKNTRAFCLVTP